MWFATFFKLSVNLLKTFSLSWICLETRVGLKVFFLFSFSLFMLSFFWVIWCCCKSRSSMGIFLFFKYCKLFLLTNVLEGVYVYLIGFFISMFSLMYKNTFEGTLSNCFFPQSSSCFLSFFLGFLRLFSSSFSNRLKKYFCSFRQSFCN